MEDSQQAAPTIVPTNNAGSLANPSLGIGLSGVTDWATQLPFINIMKSARTWTGHVGGQWGGMSHDDLEAGGYLDENGWPMKLPDGVTGITTLMLTDLPSAAVSANGRYRVRYEGQGLVEISSAGRTVAGSGGEAWFTAEVSDGSAVNMTIIRTDPNNTGDYLRNFTIVKEENIAAFEAGEIFNPLWIDLVKDMRLFRFMDWMATNDSKESEWANRPKVDDYTYTGHGVPLEIMIRLANEVGADPWFNIPHLATDDYIRQFATTVRDTLDPLLKTHVEFSNEVWNWQFDQAHWAEQSGMDRWGRESAWVQFYAVRASQMAMIWDEVYGAEADDRLVKVIAVHTGWLGLEDDTMNASLWVAESSENKPPHDYFDAYAITGYFGGLLGTDKAPLVMTWLDDSLKQAELEAASLPAEDRAEYIGQHHYDLAFERAEVQLRGAADGQDVDTVNWVLKTIFPYHGAVAKKYGLDLIMYEGGPSIGASGEWLDNESLTDFLVAVSYSPQIGTLYSEVLEGWKAAGGTLFNVFGDVYSPGKWGSWGVLRYLNDDNPRWDVVRDFNAETGAWWETRADGTFN